MNNYTFKSEISRLKNWLNKPCTSDELEKFQNVQIPTLVGSMLLIAFLILLNFFNNSLQLSNTYITSIVKVKYLDNSEEEFKALYNGLSSSRPIKLGEGNCILLSNSDSYNRICDVKTYRIISSDTTYKYNSSDFGLSLIEN